VALLSEQVMHPDALQKPQLVDSAAGGRGRREMDLELIGWMKNESPQVQKIVCETASLADVVCFDRTEHGTLTDPNAAADTVFFPRADTFRCKSYDRETQLDGLVRTVAHSMPTCGHLHFLKYRDSPENAVAFLEALKGQMVCGGEGEAAATAGRRFSVEIDIPLFTILHSDGRRSHGFQGTDPLVKWASHQLPPVDEVDITLCDHLSQGDTVEAVYGLLMASLVGIISRPGVRKASAFLRSSLRAAGERFFHSQLAVFNLLSTPYTMGFENGSITIERRQ